MTPAKPRHILALAEIIAKQAHGLAAGTWPNPEAMRAAMVDNIAALRCWAGEVVEQPRPVSAHSRCGSIQCAQCNPDLAANYNAAVANGRRYA